MTKNVEAMKNADKKKELKDKEQLNKLLNK